MSIDNLSDTYRKSIEHPLNLYRTHIELRSDTYRSSIVNQSKSIEHSGSLFFRVVFVSCWLLSRYDFRRLNLHRFPIQQLLYETISPLHATRKQQTLHHGFGGRSNTLPTPGAATPTKWEVCQTKTPPEFDEDFAFAGAIAATYSQNWSIKA